MDDIDRRIAATPPFPGLRHFYEGRRFKQWTGDDSKALMKIYLPAIAGHVPDGMVQAIAVFLDFCYLVRRSTINHDTLCRIEDTLNRFYEHRKIFVATGVRQTISLPRQHSMKHYIHLIQEYGAPNGLCSSITESKHIKAVKEPWRRSSRFEALGQMLKTNSRLSKLTAARAYFKKRGMLHGTALSDTLHQMLPSELQEEMLRQEREVRNNSDDDEVAREDDEGGPVDIMKAATTVDMAKRAREWIHAVSRCIYSSPHAESGYPRTLDGLADHIMQPELKSLIRRFLFDQCNTDSTLTSDDVPLERCPKIHGSHRVLVFHSAVSTYYSPSEVSGLHGMRRERIRSCPSWRRKEARRDCAFAVRDLSQPGMPGMFVVRVLLFISFIFEEKTYPCALVEWFSLCGNERDPITGMWVVEPDLNDCGQREVSVLHLDAIVRNAHLIPVFGETFLPGDFHHSLSLSSFRAYYVNQYADHHIHEVLVVD
ncbi:hypothetical protein PHLCEN_2v8863 [Hermanssonia centrifuga]|uniref:Uncharacterized protein n=1 Tax=Hermanssonia centrifuga TaxID=98765 RepID=A0A2R6NSE4_9APHY|nr:hypothetical protein PHLCEN_2v8863 [Hermanssonia centrifuga]